MVQKKRGEKLAYLSLMKTCCSLMSLTALYSLLSYEGEVVDE